MPPLARCLSLAVLLAAPEVAFTQQEPPEGCFCLAEAKLEVPQLQYGCERKRFSDQFYWSAICRYVHPDGSRVTANPVRITEAWTVVPAGEGDCQPCEPVRRTSRSVPRGESDEVTDGR